jgi:hypothetical protein
MPEPGGDCDTPVGDYSVGKIVVACRPFLMLVVAFRGICGELTLAINKLPANLVIGVSGDEALRGLHTKPVD